MTTACPIAWKTGRAPFNEVAQAAGMTCCVKRSEDSTNARVSERRHDDANIDACNPIARPTRYSQFPVLAAASAVYGHAFGATGRMSLSAKLNELDLEA